MLAPRDICGGRLRGRRSRAHTGNPAPSAGLDCRARLRARRTHAWGPSYTKLFVDNDEKLRMMSCVYEEMIMSDRQPPRPTDSELAILRVLWELGPSTVRDVHEQLNKDGATGYTTVLKLLQIMTEKGLVVRDETERAHVYESRYGEQKTQRQLLTDLAERAFGGSATKLVMQALSGRKANTAELNAIRELLDTLEGESR